jgi:hypothetical protein
MALTAGQKAAEKFAVTSLSGSFSAASGSTPVLFLENVPSERRYAYETRSFGATNF